MPTEDGEPQHEGPPPKKPEAKKETRKAAEQSPAIPEAKFPPEVQAQAAAERRGKNAAPAGRHHVKQPPEQPPRNFRRSRRPWAGQ